jgi:murein DD-endopeptidase MepM/ murein hydrolase activator NlpD
MKLIILRDNNSRSLTFDSSKFKHRSFIIFLFIFTLVIGASLSWLVYFSKLNQLEKYKFTSRESFISEQELEFTKIKIKINSELKGMLNKVAELQSRLIRLDALGEKIAINSNFDNGEFDFSRTPGIGGLVLEDDNSSSVSKSEATLSILMDSLSSQIEKSEYQLNILDKQLFSKEFNMNSFIAGKPVLSGWMSSKFGNRIDPFSGKPSWHNGVDFAGKFGDEVIAVASGVVVFSGKKNGYGNLIEINHGNGYVTRYAHNQSHLVVPGDIVEKGQIIAKMGSSGRSTGPHVHFEILRNNKNINPERYIYR